MSGEQGGATAGRRGRLAVPREGDLRVIALPLVVQALADDQETGILTVQGETDIVAVSFLSGDIVAADALNQTVEEGLGKVLVARGLVDQAAFETLAREHQGGRDGTLADLLVARGLVERAQLLEGLRDQTRAQLFSILGWHSGDFKFYSGDEVSYEKGMEAIQVEELLVASIAEIAGAHVPAIGDCYRRSPSLASIRLIGRDPLVDDASAFWLTIEEHALWQRVDGERVASEVMPALRPRRLQAALFRLLELGLLERMPQPGVRSQQVGATEIFMPPDPGGDRSGAQRSEPIDRRAMLLWMAHTLALVALVVILALAVTRPVAVLLPFPWQGFQRDAVENQLRQSRLDVVESAARSFFLMEQRFPENLMALADSHLLAARDLRDPSGAPFTYAADAENACQIGVRDSAQGPGAAFFERYVTIASDDFLLGDILIAEKDEKTAPIYLID